MANFRDINSASRNLNRVTDINLEPENRKALEAVMVALAAGGRVQEMAVIAQTLEKTSREMQIADTLNALNSTIAGLKQPQAEHTPDIFELMSKIDERLSVIEGERLSK